MPYLRDKKLANDNAKSSDVILDILNRVEKKYDSFIMLQPTSPLRTEKNIIEAYKMYLEKKQIVLFQFVKWNIHLYGQIL